MKTLSLQEMTYEVKSEKGVRLDSLTIDFFAGKTYCILSKNPFEKALLLAMIAGFDDCSSGQIKFEEQPLEEWDKEIYRGEKVGLILQENNFIPQLSIIENLRLMTKNISAKKITANELYEVLKSVGIEKKVANSPVKNLSLLNQQKACLAKAIVKRPKIILVEEPALTLSEVPLDLAFLFLKKTAVNQNSSVIFLSKSSLIAEEVDELWGLNGGKLTFIKEQ